MSSRRKKSSERTRPWGAALLAIGLLAAGCGVDDETPAATQVDGTIAAEIASTTSRTTTPDPTPTTAAGGGCTPPPETTASSSSASSSSSVGSSSTEASSSTLAPTSGPTTTSSATTAPTTTGPTTTVDPELQRHQQRLTDLGYWLGSIDGVSGSLTAHAVTAFQKAEGLPRTGELDEVTVERLAAAVTPTARSDSGSLLEVDLARQILLVVSAGDVVRIYDIATGAPATPTPPGQFEIYREIDGLRHAPLGTLYRPKYFNDGIALHGYTSVPAEPASHGCVRLTYAAIDHLWASGDAPVGTTVLVY